MHSDLLIARSLTWRYLIALTLVAMLTTAAWLSLYLVISEQKSTAAVVNISGRQRMLSQRTALFSTLLVNAPPEKRLVIRSQLQEAAQLMQRSHRGLTLGSAAMGLPVTLSASVRALYFEPPVALDRQVEDYLGAVQALLKVPDEDLSPANPLLQYIIAVSPSRLVASLDQMVTQYQREGEASVSRLQRVETIVWLVTLLLLVLEAAFIFHPFVRQIRIVIGKLHGVADRLRLSQEELEQRVEQRTRDLAQKSTELGDSEEKFRQISTSAKDAILIIDQAQAITYWNPAATAMFGYSVEQVLGRNLHDLLAPPRYQKDIHRGFAQFCLSGRGPMLGRIIEVTALRQGGEEFAIELSISTLHLNGQVHALGIVRDISERKRAEEQLRASEERWKFALEGAGDAVWDWNLDSDAIHFSPRLAVLLGWAEEQLGERFADWKRLIHADDWPRVEADIAAYREGRSTALVIEHRALCRDGSWKWLLVRGMAVSRDGCGRPSRMIGTQADISERKLAEARDYLLVSALEAVDHGVVITDAGAKIEWANAAFETLTGYSRDEAIGRGPSELVKSGVQTPIFYQALWRTLLAGDTWRGEVVNKRKDGSLYDEELIITPVKDEAEVTRHFVAVKQDISERKRMEAELRESATTDFLTGLSNRRHFMTRMEEQLARAKRQVTQRTAVLMVDLDQFKHVNDTYGHATGDALLRHVAVLLREGLRKIDSVGRLGGEEFAFILPGNDLAGAQVLAERMRQKIEAMPLVQQGLSIPMTVSIGIAAMLATDTSTDQALVRADQALYQAKAGGRNRVELAPEDPDGASD